MVALTWFSATLSTSVTARARFRPKLPGTGSEAATATPYAPDFRMVLVSCARTVPEPAPPGIPPSRPRPG
ncbi:hypothetical protein G6F68_020879 [Rhizopus microsporus]|nr:hypothetical protein G6F68_020879 [Rhizopus microsporus]